MKKILLAAMLVLGSIAPSFASSMFCVSFDGRDRYFVDVRSNGIVVDGKPYLGDGRTESNKGTWYDFRSANMSADKIFSIYISNREGTDIGFIDYQPNKKVSGRCKPR